MKKLLFRSMVTWPLVVVLIIALAGNNCYGQEDVTGIATMFERKFVNSAGADSISRDTIAVQPLVISEQSPVNHNKNQLLNPMLQRLATSANDTVYNNIRPLKEYHLE